jgi:hypothetical protein
MQNRNDSTHEARKVNNATSLIKIHDFHQKSLFIGTNTVVHRKSSMISHYSLFALGVCSDVPKTKPGKMKYKNEKKDKNKYNSKE